MNLDSIFGYHTPYKQPLCKDTKLSMDIPYPTIMKLEVGTPHLKQEPKLPTPNLPIGS